MKEKYLWRAVQVTLPVSGFFSLAFVVGLIGQDYTKAALSWAPIAAYFFVFGRVAAHQAGAEGRSTPFDWFQFACYWLASVGVIAPFVIHLIKQ